MESLLRWTGRLAGLAGVVICVAAILGRLSGSYIVAGFQVGTLLLAGIAAMLVGCLGYLTLLVERSREWWAHFMLGGWVGRHRMGESLLKFTVILLSTVNASVWEFYTESRLMALVWIAVAIAFAYWMADDLRRRGFAL
jgi:hypothetical protein